MKDKFEVIYPNPGGFRVSGYWTAEVRGPDGQLRDRVAGTNVVTTNGKDLLTSFLVSAAASPSTFTIKYIAVGTGSNPETASDTALVSELGRTLGTVTHNGTGVLQVVASFGTNSATGAITEYGLFNSSAAGVLFARDTETVLNVGSSDTLTVTAQITLS